MSTVEQVRSDAAGAAYHALLPNLVSVCDTEEDISTRIYVDSGRYSVIDHKTGACHYARPVHVS